MISWLRAHLPTWKYFKPLSLTWWASVVPLLAGIILALAPEFDNLRVAAVLIQSVYPSANAAFLINAGLLGIGLRGAMP